MRLLWYVLRRYRFDTIVGRQKLQTALRGIFNGFYPFYDNFKDLLYDEKIRTKIPFPFIKEVEFENKTQQK